MERHGVCVRRVVFSKLVISLQLTHVSYASTLSGSPLSRPISTGPRIYLHIEDPKLQSYAPENLSKWMLKMPQEGISSIRNGCEKTRK